MKHGILVVGTALKINGVFLDYIYESYKRCFESLGDTFFSPKTDPNLPFLIEKLSSEYEKVTIFAHKESFTLVNKIISTLTQDSLSLKEDILLPSKVSIYEKNSYLVDIDKCTLNVLHVEENKTIPNILHVKQSNHANLHLIGFDEDSSSILLEAIKQTNEVNTISTPIVQGWLKIEAKAKTHGNIKEFCKNANDLFRGKIFIANNPIAHIVTSLQKHEKTISVAESCTGGLISSLITKIPGSSNVYEGGLTTYSNRIKTSWLGVDEGTLNVHGAVSEATVKEMLQGTLNTSNADFALAVSGVAGPDGGTKSNPVGTVFVGVANKEGKFLVERLFLQGDRHYIQNQSAYGALKLLLDLGEKVFFK